MIKYKVCITEKLSRIVEINSDNMNDAVKEVKRMYREEEIILDECDLDGVEFKVL